MRRFLIYFTVMLFSITVFSCKDKEKDDDESDDITAELISQYEGTWISISTDNGNGYAPYGTIMKIEHSGKISWTTAKGVFYGSVKLLKDDWAKITYGKVWTAEWWLSGEDGDGLVINVNGNRDETDVFPFDGVYERKSK